MQPTQISQADRSPDVEPAIRHVVPWRVASVSTLPDSLLRVTFVDGTMGDVDLRSFLNRPKPRERCLSRYVSRMSSLRWEWSWVRCNGPMALTWLPMPCTTRLRLMAGGLLSENQPASIRDSAGRKGFSEGFRLAKSGKAVPGGVGTEGVAPTSESLSFAQPRPQPALLCRFRSPPPRFSPCDPMTQWPVSSRLVTG